MNRPQTSRWSIGTLAPALLSLAIVLDLVSRFLPYDPFCFREWEVLCRFRIYTIGGIFEPNRVYRNERTYGGNAAMGNKPRLRQYHATIATTDAYGFRNLPSAPDQRYELLLIGSSFSGGATLADDETLSASLARATQQSVYNAAGADLSDERQLSHLQRRLHLTDGVVVHEYVTGAARLDPKSFRDTERARSHRLLRRAFGDHYEAALWAHSRLSGWLSVSPLKLALFKGFKAIENDSLLPNSFAALVFAGKLENGDDVVFLNEQVQAKKRYPIAPAVAYWRRMAEKLAEKRLQQLVVLVPDQYAVYAPLVSPPAPARDESYLDELEQGLRRAGLPVLNLTNVFKSAAREGLPAKHYIYWRDDTHWNADGAKLAAEEIARVLPSLPALAPATK